MKATAALLSLLALAFAALPLGAGDYFIGVGLSVLFGLISGVYPAWRMSRLHPVAALRGAAR